MHTLEKLTVYLQKRDGIDKVLKTLRYASRLIAATAPPNSELQIRAEALQSSVGTSRKAYRLGKFLQDVVALQRVLASLQRSRSDRGAWLRTTLELISYIGEGTYLFLDQFLWLAKAGVLPKGSVEQLIVKASAWSEATGYAASITLSLLHLQDLDRQEKRLQENLARAMQQLQAYAAVPVHVGCNDFQEQKGLCPTPRGLATRDGNTPVQEEVAATTSLATDAAVKVATLKAQLRALGNARTLRLAAVAQDLADSLLAINDITDARYRRLSHPVVLALAGLLSAAVSSHKNWSSIK